jgi:hypothetical protein
MPTGSCARPDGDETVAHVLDNATARLGDSRIYDIHEKRSAFDAKLNDAFF